MTLTRLKPAPALARTLLASATAILWLPLSSLAQQSPQTLMQTPLQISQQTPLQTTVPPSAAPAAPGSAPPMGRSGAIPMGKLPAGVVAPANPMQQSGTGAEAGTAAPASGVQGAAPMFEEEIVPQRYADNPAVDLFINDMVARYDFDAASLHTLFNQVSYSASAIKLVTPAPIPFRKNWHVYESRFVDPIRINAGLRFWHDNEAVLQSVSQQYGVPPEIIVSLIGVETMYGRYMGNFRVMDVLTTLAFDYPDTPNRNDRQALFRKNLADFLIWARNAGIDPTTVRGSYTGAIGIPQFLPSSIMQYGVSYSGAHNVDLRGNASDAIASVANFLKQQGWQSGRPIVWKIAPDTGSQGIAQAAADGQAPPHWPLGQLLRAGMELDEHNIDVPSELSTPVTVVDLPTPDLPTEYLLGLQNFYVLTRYNQSFFYASAVYRLSERLAALMQASGATQTPPTAAMAPAAPAPAAPSPWPAVAPYPSAQPANANPAPAPTQPQAAPLMPSTGITPPLQSQQQ